jgi:hypothetical protein
MAVQSATPVPFVDPLIAELEDHNHTDLMREEIHKFELVHKSECMRLIRELRKDEAKYYEAKTAANQQLDRAALNKMVEKPFVKF